MPFVLDASIATCWALGDEDHDSAAAAQDRIRHDTALVPTLWWYQIRNIPVVNEHRGRMAEASSARFLRATSRLRIEVHSIPADVTVMAFARRYRLTVYDATYLELAHRTAISLATLDTALAAAAVSEGVAILGRWCRNDTGPDHRQIRIAPG